MAMSGGSIFWIASYPKSGNTWIRCLLDSLLRQGQPPRLDKLIEVCPNGAVRTWLESVLDLPCNEMIPPEIAVLRAAVYRQLSQMGQARYIKVHDRYDAALFPPEASAGIVYILRDPRDVAPSWADFMGRDLDETIDIMATPGLTLGRSKLRYHYQCEQVMGSWSENATSWLDQRDIPVLLLRYEDLMAQPENEVGRLVAFLNIAADHEMVAKAVDACSFDQLRGLEAAEGFDERPDTVERFFRQGKAGAWSKSLSAVQSGKIESGHGQLMQRMGYSLSTE